MKKKAIVTGGTGTIGAALVKEFSRDYEVNLTYLNDKAGAEKLKSDLGVNIYQCDITDSKAVKDLVRQIDGCDLLINNAGISQIKLFTDITDDEWLKMLDVHLNGAFYITKAVLPYMINKKCGNIINISSIWGRIGASCEVHYSAAKAGLIGFTMALAKEVGLSGVRVNCIAPGVIEGKMNSHLTAEELEELKANTALNKLGKPEDVSAAARYITEAEFMTGQVIGLDGGMY